MSKRARKLTPKETNTYPVLEVIWRDAAEFGDIGWNNLKDMQREASKPCPTMRSVGYCVYHGEDHVALLSTIGDDECSRLDKIPLAFVLELNYLRGGPNT